MLKGLKQKQKNFERKRIRTFECLYKQKKTEKFINDVPCESIVFDPEAIAAAVTVDNIVIVAVACCIGVFIVVDNDDCCCCRCCRCCNCF